MSENAQKQVTAAGGGVLDQIFKMLFKGIDNILDSAAEYENDMGVLKQVTKIKVKGPDNKEYEVKIKLAPVKDRENIFYVEVESTYPDFNGESMDKKTAKLDKKNKADFDKMVLDLLKENELEPIEGEASEDTGGTGTDSEVIDCYDEDEFYDWEDQGGQPPEVIEVTVTKKASKEKGKVDIRVTSDQIDLTYDGEPLEDVDGLTDGISPNDVDGRVDKILKENHLVRASEVDDLIEEDELTEDEEDTATEEGTPAATHVDVQLSYVKSSDEINLTAIYANYDVNSAMNSLQLAIDNDDFMNMLTEEPQCFRITDEGDDLDIAQIAEVDISNVNCDINNAIGNLAALLDVYYVDMDPQQQAAADELTQTLQRARNSFKSADLMEEL